MYNATSSKCIDRGKPRVSRRDKNVRTEEPHRNALCTQTINPLLPQKFIHPSEIRKERFNSTGY